MKIEVLYFGGCLNHEAAVERVKEALREEGLSAEIAEVNVQDAEVAQSLQFLGSPSVRIEGLDIEPAARSSRDFGLMCRTYTERGNPVGVPPLDLIRTALKRMRPAL